MNIQQLVQKWIDEKGYFGAGINFLPFIQRQDVYARLSPYLQGHFVPDAVKEELRHVLATWLAAQSTTSSTNSQATQLFQADRTEAKPTTKVAEAEPVAIVQLREEAKRLHKRHTLVNASLHHATSDEQRLEIATEIMETIIPALDHIYDQIRAYQTTGIIPEAPTTNVVQETVAKMQRLQSIRSRISRLKKAMTEKNSAKKQQEYELELLEKETEAAQIEKALGI